MRAVPSLLRVSSSTGLREESGLESCAPMEMPARTTRSRNRAASKSPVPTPRRSRRQAERRATTSASSWRRGSICYEDDGAEAAVVTAAEEEEETAGCVDYQDTTTWPSWAARPACDVGVQLRVFEILDVGEGTVQLCCGVFLFWTVPKCEDALARVRGIATKKDQHGFEHLLQLDPGSEEAEHLQCPKWTFVNSAHMEESTVDRDFTVLRDGAGTPWLFQYRKFKADLVFSQKLAAFPFDTQTLPLTLTLREERGRRLVPIDGLPCVLFVKCAHVVEMQWRFVGAARDRTGRNFNRGTSHELRALPNGELGYKCRLDVAFFMHRNPTYYLVNYLAVVYATNLLGLIPFFMPAPFDGSGTLLADGMASRLELCAALVLSMIAIRLTYVQELRGKTSEFTWLDRQMLGFMGAMYVITAAQAVDSKWVFEGVRNAMIALLTLYPVYILCKIQYANAARAEEFNGRSNGISG